MYLKDKKILYIHIPKTGGQSITKFLYRYAGFEDQFNTEKNENTKTSIEELYNSDVANERCLFVKNNGYLAPGPISLTHMTLEEFVANGYITRKELQECSVFSTVRNPYERLISACNFRQIAPDWRKMIKVVNGDKQLEVYRHFMTQYEYITLDGDPYITDIIRVEKLESSSQQLFEGYGITGGEMPCINKSPEKYVYESVIDNKIVAAKKPADISEDTIKWINDHYHNDFEQFGYDKL